MNNEAIIRNYKIIITVIVIILLLLLFAFIFSKNRNIVMIEGLNTFNGRMAIDDQYFYDKLFDDVVYYPNDYERDYERGEEIGKLVKTGWVKCLEEVPPGGHCVEFGVSGASYLFPY